MTLDEAMFRAQRKYCRQVLEETDGNLTRAAQIAGRDRTAFYKLLTRLGMGRARAAAPLRLETVPVWRRFVSSPMSGSQARL